MMSTPDRYRSSKDWRLSRLRQGRVAGRSWSGVADRPRAGGGSLEETSDTRHRNDLYVVLVEPQIPPNTGTIARSCAASRVGLHLVEPLGFTLDDTKLKRAGLDYWPAVHCETHSSWKHFLEYFDELETNNGTEKRMLAYSKRGTTLYSSPETSFRAHQRSFLVFGSETNGLSDAQMSDICARCGEDSLKRIPICEAHVRSLNLSVAVGIALWEGIRQLDYNDDAPSGEEPSLMPADESERQRHVAMYDRRVVSKLEESPQ